MYQDEEIFVDRKIANRSRRNAAKRRARPGDYEPRMHAVGAEKPDHTIKKIERAYRNVNISDFQEDFQEDLVTFEKKRARK